MLFIVLMDRVKGADDSSGTEARTSDVKLRAIHSEFIR
jgi:hypothetical protein